ADPTNSQFVYATWTQFDKLRGVLLFSRSTDGGQTWEPAREIFDPGPHNNVTDCQIVVLPDGTLVNAFREGIYKGGISQISLLRSADHGQTWLPAGTPILGADIMQLDDLLVPNPDGGLGIIAPNFNFDLAVDPGNGNLYAVWQDARFSNFQYTSIAFS